LPVPVQAADLSHPAILK